MMSSNADLVDLALERLLAITWELDVDRGESHYALLKEYFRRVGLWSDVLSPDKVLPFHVYDLSSEVAPMPEVVRKKIESVWEAHLEDLRIKSLIKPPVKLSRTERRRSKGRTFEPTGSSGVGYQADVDVQKYLHWCGVLDSPKVQDVDLPCPYEPVIRLYERGGSYHMHHGWWKVGTISFPRPGGVWYRSCPPLLTLDDPSLDKIDSAELRTKDVA